MSINLPRAPDPSLFASDAPAYIRALADYHNKVGQELERYSRQVETPAKAAFIVTNIPAPTTTLDGATAGIPEILNYLGGLHATLLAKGITRTKVGA